MNFTSGISCIVLYCIVLYCIVLYCIVLYCIVLYCIVGNHTKFHMCQWPNAGLDIGTGPMLF